MVWGRDPAGGFMTIVSGVTARLRSLWRAIRRRSDVESEMSDEFRLHLELRTADLVRWGLAPREAARQARLEFGSTERYKDEARESRGLRRIDNLRVSWLDFKLGFRMLARYPGLTIVGGIAMAFAIWLGAGVFELMSQVMWPKMPIAGAERIVGMHLSDATTNEHERRAMYEFVQWRGQLRSVQDLGAYRVVRHNLVTSDGVGTPVDAAEISASAFRITRVPPLLGRALVDADEAAGAPPVVVIGEELWRSRFAGDANIIGATVRLGRTPATVVGVMPHHYRFPVNHGFWTPLRPAEMKYAPREGPSIRIFGRLTPGASIDEARTELEAIGRRTAADLPETHEHLRPELKPYPLTILSMDGIQRAAMHAFNVPLLLLILLICGNVALLIFARAATRESELAVRAALGASRARIIMQLFAEALVLGGFAAVIGLLAAGPGVAWVLRVAEVDMMSGTKFPFWFHGSLSPTTVLYAVGLTLFAAAIAGVVPALKMTRGMASLQKASAGGGGARLGGVWTAVVIAQVAVTVAFPGITFLVQRSGAESSADIGFAAHEYLSARIEMDRDPVAAATDTSYTAFLARYDSTLAEVKERLASDPAAAGVTFTNSLPGTTHPHRLVEVDAGGGGPINPRWPGGYRVSDAFVDVSYFDVLGSPILMGRAFHAGDLDSNAVPVIVNQSFVRLVLGGRNPIGRRVRYVYDGGERVIPVPERGPWYEIVGMVRDMGMDTRPLDPKVAGFYHPARPGSTYPAHVAVHVKGAPESFAPTLRMIVAQVDPTVRLYDVQRIDQITRGSLQGKKFWFQLFSGISAIALLLSLAGIYAVMSFTVARRTREIGIRVALGASQRRVIAAIFRQPIIQVAIGVAAGTAVVTFVVWSESGGTVSPMQGLFVALYAVLMMGVCLLACVVPTRRALGVEPTEALRGEG
jgi:predicted permease